MTKFLSWLRENHFFEIPQSYDFHIVNSKLDSEQLYVGFKWCTDNKVYPMSFKLNLANPNKLGHEIYRWTFFGRQEHTPWCQRIFSALLIMIFPGFPRSLIFGGRYVLKNLLKSILFSPYYLLMSVYNNYIELREGMTRHSYAKLKAFRHAGLNDDSIAVLRKAMQQLHQNFDE